MTIRLSNKPLQACLRQDQLDILLKYEMKRDELGSNIAAGEQQFTAGDHLTLKESAAKVEAKLQRMGNAG